jgi:biopolymer transport protein TolR
MGIAIGGKARHRADINMTPMIDVLLVLIIIFMVITPLTPAGLRTLLPQPPRPDQDDQPRPRDIVVTVESNGTVLLNAEPINRALLRDRLARIFQARGDEVIFVRGAKELDFREIAEVIDIAQGAGLQRVALMTQ